MILVWQTRKPEIVVAQHLATGGQLVEASALWWGAILQAPIPRFAQSSRLSIQGEKAHWHGAVVDDHETLYFRCACQCLVDDRFGWLLFMASHT